MADFLRPDCAATPACRPTRRRFFAMAASFAAAAQLPRHAWAQDEAVPAPAKLTGTLAVEETAEIYTLPPNFTGLSYESAQLANPSFFSAGNKALIHLFRELSPRGVLRLGGNTSELTTFSTQAPSGPPPFETFGPDTSKTVKAGTTTTELAIKNLRAFLDAAGWDCLYGLNLGQGAKENAVAEAEAVHRILGPRLVALQIGNEPDAFRGRYRPLSYGPEDYIREWVGFHDAIVARVPGAKFAGPDISNKLAYLTAFAAEAPKHADIILLTDHYYAMGPARNPAATLDNLLSPDPKLTTLKWSDVPIIQQARQTAHLPFRVSEMNSCWDGGKPGVSDVFGSALWCADVMLRFASIGFSGVNLHGGGNGFYSPIVGSPSAGFTRRPEYFGIQFGQRFAGATLLRTRLECNSDRAIAYAARVSRNGKGGNLIAVINKTAAPAELQLTGSLASKRRWQAMRLTGPSPEAKAGIAFEPAEAPVAANASLHVDPYSAVLLEE